jgi:hypothetical protein
VGKIYTKAEYDKEGNVDVHEVVPWVLPWMSVSLTAIITPVPLPWSRSCWSILSCWKCLRIPLWSMPSSGKLFLTNLFHRSIIEPAVNPAAGKMGL